MDQVSLSSFPRADNLPRQYLGGAQEFGQRHTNWRELWAQVVQPHHGGTTDLELMHSLLCLVLPDSEKNKEIATTLITKYGNFANAISIPLPDHDYGESFPMPAAIAFKIVQMAGQRLVEREITDRPALTGQKRLIKYLTKTLKHKTVDQVSALFLDASDRLLADELIAGRVSSSGWFDPIGVVRRALNWDAAKIVLARNIAHNHPDQDEKILAAASRVRDLCAGLNLIFVDYFVVKNNRIYGWIEK